MYACMYVYVYIYIYNIGPPVLRHAADRQARGLEEERLLRAEALRGRRQAAAWGAGDTYIYIYIYV